MKQKVIQLRNINVKLELDTLMIVSQIVSGGTSSTTAMKGSTETAQFA